MKKYKFDMSPVYVERRRNLKKSIAALSLTTIGVIAVVNDDLNETVKATASNIVDSVKNQTTDAECTGEQVFEVQKGYTIWNIAQNVQYEDTEVTKNEVVDKILDMNPAIKAGNLVVGQTVTLPLECHKN